MLAPFFVVSFADNLVGDVLTSLVKPLQEGPHLTSEAGSEEGIDNLHIAAVLGTIVVVVVAVAAIGDVPSMMCYLASSHPQTHINVEIFIDRGALVSRVVAN
eukprot:3836763-Amphidinium_carterae.1